MKRRMEVDVLVCDGCEQRVDYLTQCFHCGVEHCYDCRKTRGVEYPHAIYASGSGDGYYCLSCDATLAEQRNDPLHLAYQRIKALRYEIKEWSEDFKTRERSAEKAVKDLFAARRPQEPCP